MNPEHTDAQTGAVWYPAPAKLNLFLRVVGRRPDGYHELQTVFRLIDRGDRLAFRLRADGHILRVNAVPGIPCNQDLCVRAATLLQRAGGSRFGVEITLDKRLPLGGGLGGGSSDAATTLLVLNRLWGLDWERARLQQLALELGADVPLFVFGENAFGQGVGERLTPIRLPEAWYVVLVPPVQVPTARIFADPQLTRNSDRITMAAFFEGGLGNDLEPVVCRQFPEVRRHLSWLRQHGPALMTGSGACVFVSLASEREATDVFSARPSDMDGFVARGLARHPLRDRILGSRQAG